MKPYLAKAVQRAGDSVLVAMPLLAPRREPLAPPGQERKRSMPRTWNRRVPKLPAAVRVRNNARWHAMADRRHRAGLSTRGTQWKRRPEARLIMTGIDPIEARLIVADIDAVAASIVQVFEYLPQMVQWRLRDLENNLARVRVNLVPRPRRKARVSLAVKAK